MHRRAALGSLASLAAGFAESIAAGRSTVAIWPGGIRSSADRTA
jgi:hypothetical protein